MQKYGDLLGDVSPKDAMDTNGIISQEITHALRFAKMADDNACSLNGEKQNGETESHKIDWEAVEKVESQMKELSIILTTPSYLLPEVRADLASKYKKLQDMQYALIMGKPREKEEKLEM